MKGERMVGWSDGWTTGGIESEEGMFVCMQLGFYRDPLNSACLKQACLNKHKWVGIYLGWWIEGRREAGMKGPEGVMDGRMNQSIDGKINQ